MEIITNNSEETINLGKDFAKKIKNGGVILLSGNLGSGKTTFVQGLAQGLGIKRRILSPTFVIVRSYQDKNFYHIDLYRIEEQTDIKTLGIEEILSDPKNIVAIEWPEKVSGVSGIEVKFSYLEEDKRKIEIKNG